MANYRLQIGHPDNQPAGLLGYRYYWLADTDAGKPVTGLNVGDLCWVVDISTLLIADSSTTWRSVSRQIFSQQVRVHVYYNTVGTTETTLTSTGAGSLTLPASWFQTGRSLRIEASGLIDFGLLTPASLRWRIKKGSTTIGDTGAYAFGSVPAGWIGVRWSMDTLVVARSSTSVYCTNTITVVGPNAGDIIVIPMPGYTATLPTGLTTIGTTSEAISLTIQFGTSTTSNENITCDAFTLTDN